MSPALPNANSRKDPKPKLLTGLLPVSGAAVISLLAVLCCAGLPAALSLLGTLGLGVLIKKHLLFPLMTISLLLGLLGAVRSYRNQGSPLLLAGYLVSAVALPLGMKVYPPAMYGGLLLLLTVTGAELARALSRPACSPKQKEILP